MNIDVMHNVMARSQAGELIFPEVVRQLLEVGVESYFMDIARGEETFYLTGGQTHRHSMTLPSVSVLPEFSSAGITSAIRAAQADAIRYPEFLKRAAEAGVVGYWAFLTGKKVIYLGRDANFHVEEFPRSSN